jgi:hypothetical protein
MCGARSFIAPIRSFEPTTERHPMAQSANAQRPPPPLGREKKNPSGKQGGRLWARKVLDIGIVSPEL